MQATGKEIKELLAAIPSWNEDTEFRVDNLPIELGGYDDDEYENEDDAASKVTLSEAEINEKIYETDDFGDALREMDMADIVPFTSLFEDFIQRKADLELIRQQLSGEALTKFNKMVPTLLNVYD